MSLTGIGLPSKGIRAASGPVPSRSALLLLLFFLNVRRFSGSDLDFPAGFG
jgi:hypothetical protein